MFDLPNIEYSFEFDDVSPDELAYFCLRFGKGDSPVTEYPMLPFTVVGVRSEQDESEFPDVLTVCRSINDIGNVINMISCFYNIPLN